MRFDVSIVSFALVLVVAIPVTTLRSQTYSVGYEIANLKATERKLISLNMSLEAKLAKLKSDIVSQSTGFDFPPIDQESSIQNLQNHQVK